MKYVALLRGINVGGKNKVPMQALKHIFETAGMKQVRTYINSGNVLFESKPASELKLAKLLEASVEKALGFNVKVLVLSEPSLRTIAAELPDNWQNDTEMKCDVMFLWEEVNTEDVMKQLAIKEGVDRVKYVRGALLWSVDRPLVTKSGIMKLIGTDLYRHMTIRNCNTLRKIMSLLDQTVS